MEKLLKIVFLQCLLLLPCVLSNSEFFNHGPLHGDNSFTRTAMNDGILSLFKDIAISCASVRQLRVSIISKVYNIPDMCIGFC